MKILYVYFHSYTGIPYHTREWVEAAIELKHDIAVVTSISPDFLESIGWKDRVKVIQVPLPSKGPFRYLKHLNSFKHVLKSEIDKKAPDLVYARFSTTSPSSAALCKKMNIPYAVEINGIPDEELKCSNTSYLRRWSINKIQAFVYKRSKKIIAVTDHIRKSLLDNYRIETEQIITIPNGVNTQRFEPKDKIKSKEKFQIPKNRFIVGYLGSLFPWYDLPLLVRTAPEIIKNIPEVLFQIGGGQEPMKTELENLVLEKGLQKYFIFLGQIPLNDAPEFTSCFDVAIAPVAFKNPEYEVSPLKLFSYMACSCPVLCSNMPGMNTIVEKAECGLIYKDDSSFISLLLDIYNAPVTQRRNMGIRGRNFVVQNYTWKQLVKESLNFINGKLKTTL